MRLKRIGDNSYNVEPTTQGPKPPVSTNIPQHLQADIALLSDASLLYTDDTNESIIDCNKKIADIFYILDLIRALQSLNCGG